MINNQDFKDLKNAYFLKNQEFLANKLKNPDLRYQFAEWLLISQKFDFSNPLLDQRHLTWHSQVISQLSIQAIAHPQILINSSKEDLLISNLITKSAPLDNNTSVKLDYKVIHLNAAKLPFTCAVLLRRILKEEKDILKFIHETVKYNDIEKIKMIAAQNPQDFIHSFDYMDKDNFTTMHYAVWNGSFEIVKLMAQMAPEAFKKGFTIQNTSSFTPVALAAYLGHTEILKLMETIASIEFEKALFLQSYKNTTPMILAALRDHLDIVEWMIKIAPKAAYQVDHSGLSMLDYIKMNRAPNYKKITDLYKKSDDLQRSNQELVRRRELSHGYHLSGYSWLIVNETREILRKIDLEGHSPFQWSHILSKHFDQFCESYPQYLNNFEAKLFKEVLEIGANQNCLDFESQLARIKNGLPIILNTGYSEHAVMLLIWDKHLVICNRGAEGRRPLEIYHFDPEKIELSDLREIFNYAANGSRLDYKKLLFEILPNKWLFHQTDLDKALESIAASLPDQTVGNCSLVNRMTDNYAIKLIGEARKVEQGFNSCQIACDEKSAIGEPLFDDKEVFFSLDSSSHDEDFVSFESSFGEEIAVSALTQEKKIIKQDILNKIKKEQTDWFNTWESFTQLTFLEHNIKPLENNPYFKPDDLLILKALDIANKLPLDHLGKEKLNQLTKIFYHYFVSNS